MNVHGTWVPSNSLDQPGYFFLWAETANSADMAKERKSRGAEQSAAFHPFACSSFTLRKVLFPSASTWGENENIGALLKRTELKLKLPSDGSRPIASDEKEKLLIQQEVNTSTVVLKPFRVEGLMIPAGYFIEALLSLKFNPTDRPNHPHAVLASDFTFWRHVAKLAFKIAGQGQWVPDIVMEESKSHGIEGMIYKGRWQAIISDPLTADELKEIAQAMPPVCRSLVLNKSLNSEQWIIDCLEQSVDHFVRKVVVNHPPSLLSKLTTLSKSLTLDGSWIFSLVANEDNVIQGSRFADSISFYAAVKEWLYPIQFKGADGGYRLGFYLHSPEQTSGTDDSMWQLDYGYYLTGEAHRFVPAAEIWREEVPDEWKERFRTDFIRASKYFPVLERMLDSWSESNLKLTLSEAYEFLTTASESLKKQGFFIHLPVWWAERTQRSQRLGLQLFLHTGDQAKGRGLNHWVTYDWKMNLGEETLTEAEWEMLVHKQLPLVQVRGRWIALDPAQVQRLNQRLMDPRKKQQATLSDIFHWQWGEVEHTAIPVTIQSDGWVQQFFDFLEDKQPRAPMPPLEGFQGLLRPYQKVGADWLYDMRHWGLGALLADDMGLGKTIELIAYLLYCKKHHEDNKVSVPSLLICPTSVVGNWQRELTKFAPSIRMYVHHGKQRLTGTELAEIQKQVDITITTYGLALKDKEELNALAWDAIVLDEAQAIKNINSKQTQAIRQFHGRHNIALTGTPIENGITELWSIMEFLNPGYLGSYSGFRSRFAATPDRTPDPEQIEMVQRLVHPFILRRVKTDPEVIQDLPEKQELKIYCSLTSEQAALYEAVSRDVLVRVEQSQGIERKGHILAALTRLKQVCNHPAHFLGDGSALGRRSGKVNQLVERLQEIFALKEKVLIFTQFRKMGDLLKRHLETETGKAVLFLHGGVPKHKRDEMIASFQQEEGGPSVFILSLKAGGVGLNLTQANHVIHFDRWWNPAVEDQATDRAYRIGQKRNVFVHKLISSGTLEERIDEMLESKRALASSIIGNGEGWITELSTESLKEIFLLRRDSLIEEE